MKLFRSKRTQIESFLSDYRAAVLSCMQELCELLEKYAHEPDQKYLRSKIQRVSASEGRADDIRRKIQIMLYSQSLFPESRGDLLGLLESVDSLANGAEATAFMLQTHGLVIPKEYAARINALARLCLKAVEAVLRAKEMVFSNFTGSLEFIGRVNELESEADHAERALIEEIFSSEHDGMQKLLLRDFVVRLVGISDRAENTGDRLRIIVAKRGL